MPKRAKRMGSSETLTVSDAATELGVEPFEVIRLLVASDAPLNALRVDHETLEKIRQLGAIERWWDGESPPEDDNPKRAWTRAALHRLLTAGFVGEHMTRMDNLWRGLALGDQDLVREATNLLVESGALLSKMTRSGVQVAISPDAQHLVAEIVSGTQIPEALSALWE